MNKRTKWAGIMFALGSSAMFLEPFLHHDWELILGVLGIAASLYLKLGTIQGELSQFKSRFDSFQERLSKLEERFLGLGHDLGAIQGQIDEIKNHD